MEADNRNVAGACVSAARETLDEGMGKIQHCIGQLRDDQLWWRPTEQMNSVANLMLHLAGNLRQWIISGVGGEKDVRNRPAEFSDRSNRTKTELLAILRVVVSEADRTLADLNDQRLLSQRRIQGFDTTVVAAVFGTIAHFRGHVQEIIHMTRVQLGAKYKFDFIPQGKEQESAASGT